MTTSELEQEARDILERISATEDRLAEREIELRVVADKMVTLEQAAQDLIDQRDQDEEALGDIRDRLEELGYSDAELREEIDAALAFATDAEGRDDID